jgi:predicted nucleic acid-binding Zn ribbon protein
LAKGPELDAEVMDKETQKKGNLRMALILLTVVIAFFVGFMFRMAFLR